MFYYIFDVLLEEVSVSELTVVCLCFAYFLNHSSPWEFNSLYRQYLQGPSMRRGSLTLCFPGVGGGGVGRFGPRVQMFPLAHLEGHLRALVTFAK